MFALNENPIIIKIFMPRLKKLNMLSLKNSRINSYIIFLFDIMREFLHCPGPKSEIEINDNIHNVRRREVFKLIDTFLQSTLFNHLIVYLFIYFIFTAKDWLNVVTDCRRKVQTRNFSLIKTYSFQRTLELSINNVGSVNSKVYHVRALPLNTNNNPSGFVSDYSQLGKIDNSCYFSITLLL